MSHSVISDTGGRVILIDSPQLYNGTVDQVLQDLGFSDLDRFIVDVDGTIDQVKKEIQTIVTGSDRDPDQHLPEARNRFKRAASPSREDIIIIIIIKTLE
jgi:hypothetical protein